MPNFKKNKSRGFKMSRNSDNPFNYGEGTGRRESPLKHDPDGYYASKEEKTTPEKPVVSSETPEKTEAVAPKKKKSSKELFDQAMSNKTDWKKDMAEYDKVKPWNEKVASWLNKYIPY